MTARNFDSLHPALQHHIVNSLGWRDLRPFQDEAIAPILAGHNVLILAGFVLVLRALTFVAHRRIRY